MVFNKNKKKGAVELSLNLIIMLIIGMVVLGLVISFVTSLVSKGVDSFDNQIGDNEKLKLEEVRNCPDNLCISPSPTISVNKGDKTNIFIKVRAFDTAIECGAGEINSNCESTEGYIKYEIKDMQGGDITSEQTLTLAGPGLETGVGGQDAKMYTLTADKSTPLGIYYLKLTLYSNSEENKISETITVEVE